MSESAPEGSLHFTCPQCQAGLHAQPHDAGTRRKCPHCDKNIKVPGIPGAATDTSTTVSRAGTPEAPRIGFECPACHNRIFAAPDQVGQSKTCDECLETVTVPPISRNPEPTPAQDISPETAPASSAHTITADVPQSDGNSPDDERVLPTSFAVTCAVCGTRLHVHKSQIGSRVPCPDCFTTTKVPTPKLIKKPKPAASVTGPSSPGPTANALHNAQSDVAEQALESATIEIEAEQERIRERESKTRLQNLLAFLLFPEVLTRVIGFSILLTITIFLFNTAQQYNQGMLAALGMILAVTGLIIGGVSLLIALPNAVVITVETANGNYEIDELPGLNFMEHFGQILYIGCSLMLCAGPYLGLSYLLQAGGSPNPVTQLMLQCLMACCFPVLLLSALECQSPILIWSPAILESILDKSSAWIEFWITTVLLMGGQHLLRSIVIARFLPLSCLLIVTVIFIYFRAMGLLAWNASKIFEDEPGEPTS